MDRRVKLILIALIVLVMVWAAYAHHVRIAAWVWHFRHGTALSIGNYNVPVPKNWYVEGQPHGGQLLVRIDTADRTATRRLKAHASILLLPESPLKEQDFRRLLSLDSDFLKQHGVDQVLQQTFNVDSGTIACVGGDRLGSTGILDMEPVSWRCKSSIGLQIMIGSTDLDLRQVWEIVSGIRRKS